MSLVLLGAANVAAQQRASGTNHPVGLWTGTLSCSAGDFNLRLDVKMQTHSKRFVGTYALTGGQARGERDDAQRPLIVRYDAGSKTVFFRLNEWPVAALDPDNVQMTGQLDKTLRIFSGKAMSGDCRAVSLRRDTVPIVQNPVPALATALRRELDDLQGTWDNADQKAAGRRLRALSAKVEPYFIGLAREDASWAADGDCRIARYLHQAIEQTEDTATIERWRDHYLIVCAKEGGITGDFAATQWFFVLLADAFLRGSPTFEKTLTVLDRDELWSRGAASRSPSLGYLENGGDVLRAGTMVQTGLTLSRAASSVAVKSGENRPAVIFTLKLKEALGWWQEGGAARLAVLLDELEPLAVRARGQVAAKIMAAYQALRASAFEAELRFEKAAVAFDNAIDHIKRAKNTGNSLDLVNVAADLLTRLAERHLGRSPCAACRKLDKPVARFVFWLRLHSPSHAYLLMQKGGRGFLSPKIRRRIDRALFKDGASRRFMKLKGSSLATALQGLINLQTTPQGVLALLQARNRKQARRHSQATLGQFIHHMGEFGDYSGVVTSAADFAKALVDQDRKFAAEAAIGRIVKLWFFAWGEKRLKRSDDEHVAYATRLAPLFTALGEFQTRGRPLKNYPGYLRAAYRMITAKLKREWQIASLQAVPALRELRPAMAALSRLLMTAKPSKAKLRRRMHAEGFALMQIAMLTDTAAALQVAVRRREIERRGVADLVAHRERLLLGVQQYDAMARQQKWFFKPIGAETAAADARREIGDVERKIAAAGFDLDASLGNASNVASLSSAARLLAPSERILIVHTDRSKTSVVLVGPGGKFKIRISDLGRSKLSNRVNAVRAGLTIDFRGYPDFPVEKAHRLYVDLFGGLAKAMEAADRVVSVVSGPLQAIPLSVLVTKRPKRAVLAKSRPRDPSVAWFVLEAAETRTPSIATFAALRARGAHRAGKLALLGVGDPVLASLDGNNRSPDLDRLRRTGSIADVAYLRSLTSLPETADELRAIRDTIGSGVDRLLLGAEATESQIKALDLERFNVLAFATHGVVAGQAFEGNEPGLVLTPPSQGTAKDDGFLSMSEVAGLRLDAELVLLSACDTATSDGRPLADGLSGLARAFFVAGARNIIATHWAIPSLPSVAVTTNMMRDYVRRTSAPPPGRARPHWAFALQAAQHKLIHSVGPSVYGHPASWGAFQVIGAD